MTAKIRVLVVDDSTIIRRLVTDILSADPEIEVVGTAPDGQVALTKLGTLAAEVVTLDIEMPVMDGLETLVHLRKTYPRLPVIMFSTLTSSGAVATLDALARGATDYVTKPANVGSVTEAMQHVRSLLIPKIKTLARSAHLAALSETRASLSQATPTVHRLATIRPTISKPAVPPTLIGIGVSTGGPNALAELLPRLPKNLPVPIVVVQHMPPIFTKHLAERLDAVSAVRVVEASDGELLQSGSVYLAPGGHHLEVMRGERGLELRIVDTPPENSCRPAVDVLFRSIARTCGAASIGCILTGMGRDGLKGCEAMVQAGARIFVQDQPSSVVWGMPGVVAEAGLAEKVVPLVGFPFELQQAVRHSTVAPSLVRS